MADIWAAAEAGDVATIQSIVQTGATVNERNEAGETPLMLACQNNHVEAASWLIMANAQLNERDTKLGVTPLLSACIGGHYKVVEKLLEAKADPDLPFDAEGNSITPLMFAVQYAGVMLVQGQPWAHHGAICRLLLRAGASVAKTDARGRTALMFAAELGHVEIITWLLQANSPINAQDETGATALMFASKGAHPEVVKLLLTANARVSVTNARGCTAMHFAAGAGNAQICEQLRLSGGEALADLADNNGDTPLGMAIAAGRIATVGWLVDCAKASLDTKDKEGRSCLDLAAIMFSAVPEEGRQVILQYLQNKGARFAAIDQSFIKASHECVAELEGLAGTSPSTPVPQLNGAASPRSLEQAETASTKAEGTEEDIGGESVGQPEPDTLGAACEGSADVEIEAAPIRQESPSAATKKKKQNRGKKR